MERKRTDFHSTALQVICSRGGCQMDEAEVSAVTSIAQHTGEALANIALRESPTKSVLLGVLHKDYASCLAGIVNEVRSFMKRALHEY